MQPQLAFLAALPLRTHVATVSFAPDPHLHQRTRTPAFPRAASMTISPTEPATAPSPAPDVSHKIPSAFDFRNQWYPAIWTADLTTAPHAFTLWDRPLVLFHDTLSNSYIVLDDVCPHRAAPLSGGLLVQTEQGTQIQCGYHGWQFNSKGDCTDIPYADHVPNTKRACMQRMYPTAVWNGLVFVWFGDQPADEALLPVPDEFRVLKDNVLTYRNFRRKLPVSFIGDVENLVDPAHVNWVHHETGQGHRSRIPRDAGIDIEWSDKGHLIGSVLTGSGRPGYRVRITYQPPSSVFYVAPFGFLLFLWHLPISHDETELFSLHGFVNPSRMMRLERKILPRWRECAVANLILDGDAVIMQGQMAELQRLERDGHGGSWKERFFMANGKWDTMVRQFRQFIHINAVRMPYENPLSADMKRMKAEDINDRLRRHTEGCVSCSRALRWANRGLWSSGVGMAMGAVMMISAALVKASTNGNVLATGVAGLLLCGMSGLLGWLMLRMRKSLVFTTLAYKLGH